MGNPWRILGWGAAVAIILAPLVVMQLGAPGVVWTQRVAKLPPEKVASS